MKNKIVLNVYRPEKGMCGVVRLNEEAERLIRQLQRETGLSAKYIIQGFDLVEIKEEKEQ